VTAAVCVLASRRRHAIFSRDWSSDVCSSDLDGAAAPLAGVPLTELAAGEQGVIVHLEDEPREVFDRLVRAGLGPWMRVEVLGSAEGGVRVRTGGREHELEGMVARSVAVERLPEGAERGAGVERLAAGEQGVIVHLEDEPREVFDRLVRAGLGPWMRVEVLGSAEGGVRVRTGGREHELEGMVARSVAVERLPEGAERDAGVETLAALRPGESARVVRISAACQGPQRRRLLDLGVVPGTRITAVLRSASGDPVAYEIRGALIALRR